LGGLLLLLGIGLLALQTETGATTAARFIASSANPLPGTRIEVDRASGTWLRSLQLTGLTLTRTDSASGASVQMAHVDSLDVRYRLLPLLQGRVHVTALSVGGPSVTMRQAADSTWDWAQVLPPSSEEDTSATMPIRVDRAEIVAGAFSAAFYADGRDSTARVRDLRLRAEHLQTAPAPAVRIDTLGLRAGLPADTLDLKLAGQGRLDASTFRLDTLRVDSPRSRVRGHGQLSFPVGPPSSGGDVAFRLQATPLTLQDLTPFLPTLDVHPDETVALDLRAEETEGRLSATVDARFSGGGRVEADVVATPPTAELPGDTLYYNLDADVRRLTTSLVGPLDSLQNRLNATAAVNLSGTSLKTLDGTATLRIPDAHWTGLHASGLSLETTVQNGTARFDLRGTLNDASVRGTGQARPFASSPSANLTVRTQGLDVASFLPDAGIASDLSATAQVDARAVGTPQASLDATVRLAPSRLGRQPLDGGTITLSTGPDRAQLNGTITFPRGRLRAAGTVHLDGSERFVLDPLRLDSVDVAALAGDTTTGHMTGTARAEGQGFSPSTTRLNATFDVQEARYPPYRVVALTGQANLKEGRLTAEMQATLNGGDWSIAAAGRPFADVPVLDVEKGRFQNVDIGPFLQDTTQSSRLSGTFRGRMEGTTPSTLRLGASVTVDSGRVNRQRLDGATLAAQLREGQLTAEGTIDTPEGGAQVAATARPFDAAPTYRLTEGTFEDLDVGCLGALSGLRTSLSGRLTLEGRGESVSSLVLDGALTLDASTINDAPLSQGQLAVEMADGRVRTDGSFALAGGHLRVGGHVDSLTATPSYDIRVEAGSLDVAALAGRDSLSAQIGTVRWTLDGRGTSFPHLNATTEFSAKQVQVDRVQARAMTVRGRLQEGHLVIDSLHAASNVLAAQGSGTLALTNAAPRSALSLRATVTDVRPLRPFVGAETLQLRDGSLSAKVHGDAGAQRLDATAELMGLAYNDLRLSGAKLTVSGTRGNEQLLRDLEIEGTLERPSLPALSAEQARLQATYDGTRVDLSTRLRIDQTHTAALQGAIVPSAEQTEVTVSRLDLRLGPDQWSLAQAATLVTGSQYRIQEFRLRSGDRHLSVDGELDPTGTQDLSVAAEEVRLDGISPLLGFPALGGSLSGNLDLTGPATAPQLDGQLTLALRSGEQEVGSAALDVGYDDFALTLDATLTHTNGRVLTVTGSVPADLRLKRPPPTEIDRRPVRLTATTDRFPVNWIEPFLDPTAVRDLQGIATADIEVDGTLEDPSVTGTASLQDGGLHISALNASYRSAQASLRFSEDQVGLEKASVRSANGGRLEANGTIRLPQLTVGTFDLTVEASDFLAINTRAYRRAVIDGSARLQGTTRKPVLEGTVQVQGADIYYTEATDATSSAVSAVSLSKEDRLTLENRFRVRVASSDTSTFDVYEAMKMDLTVRIRRGTWLRSRDTPEMNVQFTGDLTVDKAHDQDAKVFGTINVVEDRSTVRQFGQEFEITEGTLTFDGDPAQPRLGLKAVFEKRAQNSQEAEVRITLALEGRPDNLTPTLSSEPPMETSNMLSYLATGRPASELLGGGSTNGTGNGQGGSGNLGTQVLLGQAEDYFESLAASELGLDVARLQIRPSGTSYLTLGQNLTPRLFVSIEQPITPSSSDDQQSTGQVPNLTLEYRLTNTLQLRALNSQNAFEFNLFFEYAY